MKKKLATMHLPLAVDSKNNLALTLQRFGQLTLPQQQDVLVTGSAYGDKGTKNADPDFVPPYCRPGVTIAQLAKLHNAGIDGIEAACKKVTDLQKRYDVPFQEIYS